MAFNIGKRSAKVVTGKYDEEVKALLEAQAADPEATLEIAVPTGEPRTDDNGKTEYPEVQKHVRYFQESAKHAAPTETFPEGVTARVDSIDDQGDGTTVVAFYLTKKIVRPRGEEAASA